MGFQAERISISAHLLAFLLYKAFNIAQTLLMPCVLLMSIVFTESTASIGCDRSVTTEILSPYISVLQFYMLSFQTGMNKGVGKQ
jgi:hypothetical protein